MLAAYELCLKCSHLFNILDARGAISVTERVGVIARIRQLAVGLAKAYVAQQNAAIESFQSAKRRSRLMPDFLLEIGCEEIPSRMIQQANQELQKRVHELLKNNRLEPTGEVTRAETPRRLSVIVSGIPATQPDTQEQLTGPATKVAYKDGEPTPAAHAFAKKAGVDVSKLEKISTPKGEYLAATVLNKGRSAKEILAELLPKEINAIYWAKNMYWRPISLSVLCARCAGSSPCLMAKLFPSSSAAFRPDRSPAATASLALAMFPSLSPTQYIEVLRNAHVMARSSEREHRIRKALDAATRAASGMRWREDAELLDTVVNLDRMAGRDSRQL